MQNMLRASLLSEFRGNYPDVPFYDHVDVEELTKGDDGDSVFVVLPITKRGAVADSGLVHDDPLVDAIVAQMPGATGIMGHISAKDASTEYPLPDVMWVGHVEDPDGVVWGKGYIPNQEVKQHVRQMKATGGKLATSIWGPALRKRGTERGQWTVQDFEMQSLDLAPAARASLKLGGTYQLTAQMDGNDDEESTVENVTLADVPDDVRKQIIGQFAETEQGKQLISDLETRAKIAETRVAELEKTVAKGEERTALVSIATHIAEQVNAVELRPVVYRYVVSEMDDVKDLEGAKTLTKDYIESEEFTTIASAMKQPPAMVAPRAANAGRSSGSNDYDEIAKEAEAGVASRKVPG